jgi:DNA-directed RNA polymerase specialized sigma subunit
LKHKNAKRLVAELEPEDEENEKDFLASAFINESIAQLPERQRAVVEHYFGFKEPQMNLPQMALSNLYSSKQLARHHLKRALKKLRRLLTAEN